MFRMNQYSDAAMYGGSAVSTGSGLLGLVTPDSVERSHGAIHLMLTYMGFSPLDAVYAITAILGLVVAALGYLDTRRKNREENQRDTVLQKSARERDQAIIEFLQSSRLHDASKAPEVIEKVNEALKQAEMPDGDIPPTA